MGFVEAIRACLSAFARFEGRAGRAEFWWFYLFTLLASAAAGVVETIIGTGFLGVAVSLALLPPTLAAGARRLHDTGRSGWWQGAMLPPLVLAGLAAQKPGLQWLALLLMGLGIGLAILLVIRLATRGGAAPNRYGPPPAR